MTGQRARARTAALVQLTLVIMSVAVLFSPPAEAQTQPPTNGSGLSRDEFQTEMVQLRERLNESIQGLRDAMQSNQDAEFAEVDDALKEIQQDLTKEPSVLERTLQPAAVLGAALLGALAAWLGVTKTTRRHGRVGQGGSSARVGHRKMEDDARRHRVVAGSYDPTRRGGDRLHAGKSRHTGTGVD